MTEDLWPAPPFCCFCDGGSGIRVRSPRNLDAVICEPCIHLAVRLVCLDPPPEVAALVIDHPGLRH